MLALKADFCYTDGSNWENMDTTNVLPCITI